MPEFEDRDRGLETEFARDDEMMFRILARRNKLLGGWAARLMGLSEAEAEAYSKDLVLKLLGDLTAAGVEIDENRIREALKRKLVDARRQLMG